MSLFEEFDYLKVSLEEIIEATNNFADENLIGQGGFCKVYKGQLLLSGTLTNIAARRLHYDYGQYDLEFWNEISMLHSFKHDNLVSFIGFCDENGEKIIIDEHEVNGSLERHLSNPALTWMQRLKICVGVAGALKYIHYDEGHESSVIHRNIKSSKILLDENWKPKLSGFQLSKLTTKARRDRLVLDESIGTIGYVDPTYLKTGFLTHKSDVYSFGVVLFEVLCGRRAFVPDKTEEEHVTQDNKNRNLELHEPPIAPPSPIVGQVPVVDDGRLQSRPSSSSKVRPSSFGDMGQPSFGDIGPSSFGDIRPPSMSNVSPSSFGDVGPSSFCSDRPTSFGSERPMSFDQPALNKGERFLLQPSYAMKRVNQYLHTSNEESLAQLAKSHYDVDNLDDIIHPDLWKQMDTESFKLFSETANSCLKEKPEQRPNIDQILTNLQKALQLQIRYETPEDSVVAGEVEGTTSNLSKGEHLKHLRIPFIDIQVATKNFTTRHLGSGAYAKVYKAKLQLPIREKETGEISMKWKTVAIKCITESQHGKPAFDSEIELLASCRHTNIVSLLGFCDEGPNMILVYEHAYNGSLDDYLKKPHSSTSLTWVQRIQICIDIARGLTYIHTREEDEQRIIHRDIKSANILLDKDLVAKIADFGLSRFHLANQIEKTVYTRHVSGTKFYVCPEYTQTCRLKPAVDIYSFGVVLLEILSGKLAYNQIYLEENGIANVARRRFKDRTIHMMVDPNIMEQVDDLTSSVRKGPNQDSLNTYLELVYRSISVTQNERPTAEEMLKELEKALSLQNSADTYTPHAQDMRTIQENNNDNLQISFEEIKLATQNFSPENLIGVGGFGKVFKGIVTRGNGSTTIIAKRSDRRRGQVEAHFLTELEISTKYKHENIICLQGYCHENAENIIVYEYASNGSLERHLTDVSLTWTKRLNICIDIARGLGYLHGGMGTEEMVIHRDITSANILLNGDWKAKVSDFGLSVITAIGQQVVSNLVGTTGYVDPVYEFTGCVSEKSDIYSMGVVLFEILYGQLLVPSAKDYDQQHVTKILENVHGEGDLGSIVFDHIKEQIAPKSLSTFRVIVSQCLDIDREKRPTAEEVLQQLEKSLEFQEDYDIWGPKLPEDYEEILKMSKSPGIYSTEKKKDLYDEFYKGILLQDDKVVFSLGSNGERNEMISATTFLYRNHSPHDNWCIVPESRFEKVAEMLDISNLMIQIETRTQFLSPDTNYGVYLVFKFCDFINVSSYPMYVDLKYRKGSETLHAYFANWRDKEWMMIELYRFLNQKEDVVLNFLLESLSPYYCREHDAIYVEGIEFRAIDDVGHEEPEESKIIHQVFKPNSNLDQRKMPTESDMISNGFVNYDYGDELLSLTKANGKKHIMLSAKAALYNFPELMLCNSIPSPWSSFKEVLELLPQQIFRINCMIKSQMLSRDTEYVCYLVFKLPETCQELHGPVEVRDLLQRNKLVEIVYFRSPSLWNIHDFTRVPKRRTDGWMEVNVWRFNSNDHELEKDHVLVNLKLTSYKGSMSGLIVCGLEFRPM